MSRIKRRCEKRQRHGEAVPLKAEIASRLARPRNNIAGSFIALIALLLSSCSQSMNAVTPTPVIAGLTTTQPEVQNEAATPTLAPFRFDLPTPGAAPVSSWRPPLYPVPWAMSLYDHFYFVRPIAADQVNWPLANYRYGGIFFANVVHTGVDIDAPEGTPIYAAGPGTVVWANWGLFTQAPGDLSDPYGQAVAIRHDFGFNGQQLFTVYAHMSKIIAVSGQHVNTGDILGLVGHTGATTGPHVHFEVRFPVNDFFSTYNPELWMVPPQGWGVLAARITDTDGNTLQQVEITVQNQTTRETHVVKTYGPGPVNHDPYYNENMVLGDLPAGLYKVSFRYEKDVQEWMYIYPGQVTYFTYTGDHGFKVGPPPAPELKSVPKTAIQPTSTSTP